MLKLFYYRPGQVLRFQDIEAARIARHLVHEGGKVVSPTHCCLYLPGDIPGTHFCYRLSRPQGSSVAGRIKSKENANDPIGNQTCDFLVCSAVAQPTVPPCTPGGSIFLENVGVIFQTYIISELGCFTWAVPAVKY
jgi:hypothetical protein